MSLWLSRWNMCVRLRLFAWKRHAVDGVLMSVARERYRIPGLLFYGLYICTSNWLQAQGIVRPAAVAATITALLHPLVNYFTIHILGTPRVTVLHLACCRNFILNVGEFCALIQSSSQCAVTWTRSRGPACK